MNKFLGFIAIFILAILGGSALYYYGYLQNNSIKNDQIIKDINSTYTAMIQQKKIPYPGGNLIYYTSDGKIVKKDADFDYVSGRLCGKDFEKMGIYVTERYNSKYYKYTISRDGKQFEIAGIIKENDKFKTILVGNVTNNITRKFDGNEIIQNGDVNKFPYNPRTQGLVAKIDSFVVPKDGTLKIISQNGNKTLVDTNNFKDITIWPTDTVVLAGSGASAKIFFENGDLLKLQGDSVVKIKENETNKEKSKTNMFWMIGKITYEIYNTANDMAVTSPVNNIGIRGDIINGFAQIKDGKYEYQAKVENGSNYKTDKGNYDLVDKVDLKPLLADTQNSADILGAKMDVENIIKISK